MELRGYAAMGDATKEMLARMKQRKRMALRAVRYVKAEVLTHRTISG